eukprot:13151722-Alexandrium_andersonii.AAC.1
MSETCQKGWRARLAACEPCGPTARRPPGRAGPGRFQDLRSLDSLWSRPRLSTDRQNGQERLLR